jgi:hypothetical protein
VPEYAVTPHVAQNTKRSGRQCLSGPRGMRDMRQPEEEEAHRRELLVAEDDCVDPQGAASEDSQGRLGVDVRGRGVQPGANAKSDCQSGWCRMSMGEVPARDQRGPNGPQLPVLMHLKNSTNE